MGGDELAKILPERTAIAALQGPTQIGPGQVGLLSLYDGCIGW